MTAPPDDQHRTVNEAEQRPSFVAVGFGALLASLFFHSPRLWALLEPMPGSTYWDRGLQFIAQCEDPLGAPLADPGLVWRLAPAFLARALGLHGYATFVVPWLGVILLLIASAHVAWKITHNRSQVWLFTSLLSTTSAVLTPTGWLGLNDAWYALALVVLAFEPSAVLVLLALLIGPWIDERFVLGLPFALYVRLQFPSTGGMAKVLLAATISLTLYFSARLGLGGDSGLTNDYLKYALSNYYQWLPWAPLGLFMGFRAAWILAVAPGFFAIFEGRSATGITLAFLAIAPVVVITMVASDTGRTTTLLLPAAFLGLREITRRFEAIVCRRLLAALLVSNFLMPAMHVTYKSGDIINSLPVEIARLMHILGKPDRVRQP